MQKVRFWSYAISCLKVDIQLKFHQPALAHVRVHLEGVYSFSFAFLIKLKF